MGIPDLPLTTLRVELGRMLFFDPRFTIDANMSCATCHQPGLYGTDGLATSIGVQQRPHPRNAPTILNSVLSITHWRGDRESVEDQVIKAMTSPITFGQPNEEAVLDRLARIPGHVPLFKAAFPDDAAAMTAGDRRLRADPGDALERTEDEDEPLTSLRRQTVGWSGAGMASDAATQLQGCSWASLRHGCAGPPHDPFGASFVSSRNSWCASIAFNCRNSSSSPASLNSRNIFGARSLIGSKYGSLNSMRNPAAAREGARENPAHSITGYSPPVMEVVVGCDSDWCGSGSSRRSQSAAGSSYCRGRCMPRLLWDAIARRKSIH
jgi:hypothetical protein